jgi:spermidine synthase
MAQPWQTLASVPTKEGTLELRRRGERDFLITLGGLVLMSSSAHRSEAALGALACRDLRRRADARVLVSGLGMGFTLRAALDSLPATGRVTVAELNPVVMEWCRGPLAELTARAAEDPRVTIRIADVAEVIRERAVSGEGRFHAIILDLYEGPHARTHKRDDPLYGSKAIEAARSALEPGGVFAVWGESHDAGFEKRLRAAGFSVTCERPGRGGLRHVVYLGKASARNTNSLPKRATPPGKRALGRARIGRNSP